MENQKKAKERVLEIKTISRQDERLKKMLRKNRGQTRVKEESITKNKIQEQEYNERLN